jgi:hypothetical protein
MRVKVFLSVIALGIGLHLFATPLYYTFSGTMTDYMQGSFLAAGPNIKLPELAFDLTLSIDLDLQGSYYKKGADGNVIESPGSGYRAELIAAPDFTYHSLEELQEFAVFQQTNFLWANAAQFTNVFSTSYTTEETMQSGSLSSDYMYDLWIYSKQVAKDWKIGYVIDVSVYTTNVAENYYKIFNATSMALTNISTTNPLNSPVSVPEPPSLALLTVGLLMLSGFVRHKRSF